MNRDVTFIHAADLHLDSPFKGLSDVPAHLFEDIKNSTFEALNHLVDAAILHEVDFVLMVGDLFDNEKQSLKAQVRLKNAFEKLQAHDIPVYLSYGNHDYIKGNIHQITYPDNVFIFPDEKVRSFVVEKEGHPLAEIHGFSYENRAVTENKAKDYQVKHEEVPFQIATLHGSVQGNEEHAPYAPFQLRELTAKSFDYWALGHIHQRTILKNDPPIVYPGNIQGRHRKETGEKGCYLVHLTKSESNLTFLPLQAIEFRSLAIDLSDCKEVFELEPLLFNTIKQLEVTNPQLVELVLTASDSNVRTWNKDGTLAEMIEIVNESLASEAPWSYIYKTTVEIETELLPHETSFGEHFIAELMKGFEEQVSLETLQTLYQHRKARKYLGFPSEKQLADWKEEAKNDLLEHMLKGGSS